MIEIRAAEDVRPTVYITGLKLRLPADHSWVVLPQAYWMGDGAGADDLYRAFDQGLIDVRISSQSVFPNWYLDVIAQSVVFPEDFLDSDDGKVISALIALRRDAHPTIWAVARRELYVREISNRNRASVLKILQS